MTAILEVEKVVKHFGALRAVDGISFSVEEGEIFGVAGPNGSGKSTLFNIVTGVPYSAQSGVVRFKGAQIERLAPHRICRLGLVRTFQRDAVFPSLTVRENVGLAILYGARARPTCDRIEAALMASGLKAERFRPAGGGNLRLREEEADDSNRASHRAEFNSAGRTSVGTDSAGSC